MEGTLTSDERNEKCEALVSMAHGGLIFLIILLLDNFYLAAQSRHPQPRSAPAGRRQCATICRRLAVNGQKLAEVRSFHVLQAGPFIGRFDQVPSSTIPFRGFVGRFKG
jgi:hypothetical protein